MKKALFLSIFSILFVTGCDSLCDNSPKEMTEHFGNWSCVGQGIDKIEGYAECTHLNGGLYRGDIRGHDFNGRGEMIASNGVILDGYFDKGKFVAGKITSANGDAFKGLFKISDDGGFFMLELGKTFRKSDGKIELGDFENGRLSYGMLYSVLSGVESYRIGDFINGNTIVNDGYMVFPYGCGKFTNGNMTEITKTVTNTVYRNNNIKIGSPFGDFYKLGSQYNPYTVKLEFK